MYNNYKEGFIVEDTILNLIRLGKGGKVKLEPLPNIKKVVQACKKHARKELIQALPWLPESLTDWTSSEVMDKVLKCDILVNRAGWRVAIDLTVDKSAVDRKMKKMERVATALSSLEVDRAVVVLVHQLENPSNITWQTQLDAVIKAACRGDDFVSDGEIYF